MVNSGVVAGLPVCAAGEYGRTRDTLTVRHGLRRLYSPIYIYRESDE